MDKDQYVTWTGSLSKRRSRRESPLDVEAIHEMRPRCGRGSTAVPVLCSTVSPSEVNVENAFLLSLSLSPIARLEVSVGCGDGNARALSLGLHPCCTGSSPATPAKSKIQKPCT